ncbi:helix-hairpin-helix domain-containing protein [Shewanella zhangzhouensis]|uniref:helix-hairpin-helix domain-containing protein n=1 Tax=Shewanella zhangzhouensis TaxID=2864213 RepID=UPI001C65B286|nr:helix-hairpin-helix domain-containing protein [Shewanella zhangzhouensis]QYK05690.1 helix-hairpin-helix domain-containing protein [Shewanella zhangzhouensis]
MNPDKVDRNRLRKLTDLPNVGPATAKDLVLLGIHTVDGLKGQEPMALYLKLCELTGERHDPCVLDVFMSLVAFSEGEAPQPWWHYTDERKRLWPEL